MPKQGGRIPAPSGSGRCAMSHGGVFARTESVLERSRLTNARASNLQLAALILNNAVGSPVTWIPRSWA
jgi:hypothetical protein